MTDDEVERSIEFLLKNQATLETQLERTSRQIEATNQRLEETNQRLEMHAETQREFIQVVIRHIEAQSEINTSLRSAVHELTAAQMRNDARLDRTDARLDRLAETVERFITEGRNGKS